MIPIIAVFSSEFLRQNYADSIINSGGLPVTVPLNQKTEGLEKIAKIADGFLFPGGDDLAPEYYGQTPLNSSIVCEPERDRQEYESYKIVKKTGKPILGICRGIQTIAVFEGGDLYQDLPSEKKSYIYHKQTKKPHETSHGVSIIKGTLLHNILGVDSIMTNSHHHQSVKTVPPTLSVCALSEDGVIEGLYGKEHKFLLLLQWHPEFSFDTFPSNKIFDSFVKACL